MRVLRSNHRLLVAADNLTFIGAGIIIPAPFALLTNHFWSYTQASHRNGTRIISGHVLLRADTEISLSRLDEIRAATDTALKTEYPTSVVDLLFTGDKRWSAPMTGDS